ncbi:MAG: glycosyltransferase family 87 protein [Terriglobia bacterium]
MKSLPPPVPGRLAWALLLISVLLAALGCGWHPLKALDLHVYYATARSFFDHSGPMYGPNDVFGWPMLYRYPPLFLCLFRPFALLPLSAAAGLWAGLKVFLLGPLLWLWYRRFPPTRFLPAISFSALLLLPYFVHELKSGNVQFLLVELVCYALLLSDEHPIVSSLLLGLAAAVKVWPLFVLPYLAVRGRWRIGIQASLATALFTIAPALWLGWKTTFHLLAQWFVQEQRINALLGDRWYPSQSLRGVMLRYFTSMNYSDLPDSNYRLVNFVSLPSWEVRQFWLVLAVLLVLFSLACVYRCTDDAAAYSIFFCFLLMLEPNVHRSIYATLLWPALFAGIIMTDPRASPFRRWVLLAAAALAVLVPLVPGSAFQRLAQVLGFDFLAVLLPLTLVVVTYASRRFSLPPARRQEGSNLQAAA